jgi:hypothetical protein
MKQSHKHAALIKAWADGAEVEMWDGESWLPRESPYWNEAIVYRIKPEPKPDAIGEYYVDRNTITAFSNCRNLRLTFDGETGKLKNAEVLE